MCSVTDVQEISGIPRGVVWGVQTLSEIPKALQNRAKLNPIWKLLKIAEFRMPTPKDVQGKRQLNSKTTAGLQLFYINNEISCTKLQLPPEPLTRGLPSPRSPFSLSSVLNWICWTPPRTKFLGMPPQEMRLKEWAFYNAPFLVFCSNCINKLQDCPSVLIQPWTLLP